MRLVNPLKEIGTELNSVQSPSRYIGGEYGSIIKEHTEHDSYFNFAITFPDLYEIGMSNQAIKIIYNGLNAYSDIRCERVFAVDTDYEELLKKKNIPLYTLETGMPLSETDMIGFSIGYELGITEVLSCLELGNVPLLASERKDGDPIVIAGGCGVTNPAPISDFFDALFIGEAENSLFELVEKLSEMKRNGSSRKEMLSVIAQNPAIWTKENNSNKIARKAVQSDFGLVPSIPSWFPLPNSKPVQDHGVVEIMRGCPNGCRFCHAGIYYRPQRIKNKKLIIDETDHLVFDAGCREISLNSLSSADYPNIGELLDELNNRYKGYNVSFQLPSLKVNSLSLPILEKLSTVRKSGLTFAVETPEEAWQLSLNKEVYAQHLVDVIMEAKNRGWGTAKFYFMIGLPVGDYFSKQLGMPYTGPSEEETIVNFLLELQSKTKIQCNVNVGVFIPKPHTPYQWVKQISPEEAKNKIDYIYAHLPRGKFRLGKHNYNTTILEGLLSRGDERVGKVILSAYKKGARLDAWDEHLDNNMQYWNEAFEEAGWDVKNTVFKKWDLSETLPWDGVSLGPSKSFYEKEWQKSIDHILSPKCESNCTHRCGVCNDKEKVAVHSPSSIEDVSSSIINKTVVTPEVYPEANIPLLYRVIFTFNRVNGAEFVAYLSQVELFHKAFLRSGLPVVFTNGFNPLPRLEFATAISLGIKSQEEIASCVSYEQLDSQYFIDKMNEVLPEMFKLTKAFIFPITNQRKRESLCESLWGSCYSYEFNPGFMVTDFINSDTYKEYSASFSDKKYKGVSITTNENTIIAKLPFALDKPFKTALEGFFNTKWYTIAKVVKTATLAKPGISGWTDEDDKKLRQEIKNNYTSKSDFDVKKNGKEIVESTESNGQDDGNPISYYKLYDRIAAINKSLLSYRDDFIKERDSFYAEHPDVLEQRKKNSSN